MREVPLGELPVERLDPAERGKPSDWGRRLKAEPACEANLLAETGAANARQDPEQTIKKFQYFSLFNIFSQKLIKLFVPKGLRQNK